PSTASRFRSRQNSLEQTRSPVRPSEHRQSLSGGTMFRTRFNRFPADWYSNPLDAVGCHPEWYSAKDLGREVSAPSNPRSFASTLRMTILSRIGRSGLAAIVVATIAASPAPSTAPSTQPQALRIDMDRAV